MPVGNMGNVMILVDGGRQTLQFPTFGDGMVEWCTCITAWSKAVEQAQGDPTELVDGVKFLLNPKFRNFLDRRNDNGVTNVFVQFTTAVPFDLRITAFANGSRFLILDTTNGFEGIDENGRPHTKIIGKDATYTYANPQPAIVVAVSEPQVARVMSLANDARQSAVNIAAALARLKQLAVEAALRAGAQRTAAALDNLLRVAGKAATA